MKRFLIFALIVCIALSCALVACVEDAPAVEDKEKSVVEEPVDYFIVEPSNVFSSVNEFVKTEDSKKLVDSYVDGDDAYYCINLGRLKNVSVDAAKKSITYEKSSVDVKRSYPKSQVTTRSVYDETARITKRLEYDMPRSYVGENTSVAFALFDEKIATSDVRYYDFPDKENTESVVEVQETTMDLLFKSTCPTGKYRVSDVLDVDVYLYITKRISDGEYSVRVKTLAVRNITEGYVEYTDDEFADVTLSKVTFDGSEVSRLPSPVKLLDGTVLDRPANLIPETYYVDTTALSCKLGNKYNYTQKDPDCNDPHYSHDFEFGKFIVEDVAIKNYENGEFYLASEKSAVKFRLNYDPSNLPLQDTMTSRKVNSEGKLSGFYNLPFDVGEREVGMGMMVVKITYKDGSPDKKICVTDVFNGKKSGDEIDIALDIDKPCSVEISFCYEFVMWAPGLLGIVDDYWRDWRINQTFVFN